VPNAVVTVVENNPVVSVNDSDVTVAVTETAASIALGVTGLQGPTGATGATGSQGTTGPQGSSGVISVTSPITNSGSSTSAQLGLDQTAITITESQVTNLTTDLAAKAPTASPTFTGTITTPLTTAGYVTTTSGGVIGSVATIPNSGLTNSSVTVNGSAIALGGSATVTAVTSNALTLGSGLSGTSFNGSAAVTAAVDSTIPRLTADQTFTGLQTLVTSAAGNKGLIVKGSASQSVNLQEWQDSSAAVLVAINSIGGIASANRLTLGQNTTSTVGRFTILENTPTIIPVVLRLATGQTADVIQYQSQPGTVLGGRNALAQIFTGSTTPLTTAVGGATTAASGTGTTATITTTSNHNLAVGDRITVAGVTPTGYNGTFIVTAAATNSVSYANATTGSQTVAGTVSVDAQASITARSAGTKGLVVKAAVTYGTTAGSIQEWQDSAGVILGRVDQLNGNFRWDYAIRTDQINGTTDNNVVFKFPGSKNVQIGSTTASVGGGGGVIGIANATTVPSSNPTGGGILYVDTGALAYRGTSGSARTIINADGTDPNPADGTTSTAAAGIGFMGLPQNATTTGAYTVVAADAGKHIYASATRTITINSNANLALPIGTTLTFIAGSGATMTIAITTDTMYLAGAGTTGSRTLAPFGMATAVKLTSTTWIISGNGLT
jgi:hypothetical protein